MKNIFFSLCVFIISCVLLSAFVIRGSYADTTERTSIMVAADTSSVEKRKLADINASVKGGIIYGTVTDDSGDPVREVQVKLKGRNKTSKMVTDRKGYFQFLELDVGNYKIIAGGRASFCTNYTKYKAKVMLEEEEEKEVLLELEPFQGRIFGNVISDPFEGVRIKLLVETGNCSCSCDIGTDKNGFFEFPKLEKGKYRITASQSGFRPFEEEIKLGEDEEKEIIIELDKIGD